MTIADRLADRVKIPTPSLFVQLGREASALEREGRRLTYLLLGEPDFPTPPHIVAAAKQAIDRGMTHYAPVEGLPDLRRAIVARMGREQGMEVDPDRELLVTTGATMGVYLALGATISPGDEVILAEPFYGPYRAMVQYFGGRVSFIRLEHRRGHFALDLETLRAAVTRETKAIVINSPSNPTGSVFTSEELRGIGQVAVEHDLFVISDECYDAIL
jgi:aspartate aminotransferase